MPDLKMMKVLIIGSGPTTIGQAGECHEGALEACRALADKGCRLVTVDANPDAVFNGEPWSHHPIIEPLTPTALNDIIEVEKPDALLSLFSGRSGLQLMSKLYQNNTLPKKNLSVWGPSKECLDRVRDRDTLQSALSLIGLKTPSITQVNGVDDAVEKAQQLGFPVVLRCDDAQMLPDGLLIYNQDDLNRKGATLSGEPSGKLSVEASLLEWQQIELEVLRDRTGRSIMVGAIEYLDTANVHPGDAISVCPPQSLPQSLKALFQKQAKAIADHLNIVGSATLRFAYHPARQDLLVLAVHPRYTTSTALVARIKGTAMAKMSTLLAAGFTLDQLSSELPQSTQPENSTKIVGVKWPRWDFSLLENTVDRLGLQMQATGHHVGYGDTFKEALQKAARSGLRDNHTISSEADKLDHEPIETILQRLATPSSRRLIEVYAALRKKASIEEVYQRSHISPWFIEQFKELVNTEDQLISGQGQALNEKLMRHAKTQGFSNGDLARLSGKPLQQLEQQLAKAGVVQNWDRMPGEQQHLRYSTFRSAANLPSDGKRQKVLLLGSGAYGIGNGAECDYGIFQAAQTLIKMGFRPIVINNNIASSTYGPSCPCICYYDPLTASEIMDIVRAEEPIGVMTQFAGFAAVDLAAKLSSMGCNLLGTPIESLVLQQNKIEFKERIRQLGIPQPSSGSAQNVAQAHQLAEQIGYPLTISDLPIASTKSIQDPQALDHYLSEIAVAGEQPLWIEQLLEYAIEAQAEVLCDGANTHVAAVMEHIELAGVHAADSAAVIPPYSIAPRHVETITEYCHKIATALGIKGLINIRFGIYRDTVYLIETGSNISRNLAVVSKTLGAPVVEWATRLILGNPLSDLGIKAPTVSQCCVRAPVFPFNVFPKVDPLLGPNMRSTGQVMALSSTFGMAYFKALEATATPLPTQGTVLITVTDEDKSSILEPARIFGELGFRIMATKGTHKVLTEHGIEAIQVRKLGFGRPNLVDEIKNGNVQMVINTPTGGQGQIDDSVIRKAAIGCRIVNITTPASATAAAKGIAAAIEQKG
ncbi:MAG: carbamoyl-phosphate synthase large subunit [Desulfobacteraceae bacterium]|jgi:carbamoyl-phosphate synthase large subunit